MFKTTTELAYYERNILHVIINITSISRVVGQIIVDYIDEQQYLQFYLKFIQNIAEPSFSNDYRVIWTTSFSNDYRVIWTTSWTKPGSFTAIELLHQRNTDVYSLRIVTLSPRIAKPTIQPISPLLFWNYICGSEITMVTHYMKKYDTVGIDITLREAFQKDFTYLYNTSLQDKKPL